LFSVWVSLKKKGRIHFEIQGVEDIPLVTLEKKEILFSALLNSHESYLLFFDLSSCPPCIFRGINELEKLKKDGKNAIAIAINDWAEEWITWTMNVGFRPIYMLRKESIGPSLCFPYLPVLLRLKNKKVTGHKYIAF